MKNKKLVTKILAASMAAALVIGGTAVGSNLTVHAAEPDPWGRDINDGCARDDREPGPNAVPDWHDDSSSGSNGSSDSGSSSGGSSDEGSYDSGSDSGSYDSGSDSGSYDSGDSGSYDSGSSSSDSYDSGSDSSADSASYDGADSSDNGGDAGTAAPAGSGVERKGNTVTVPGFETWRQISRSAKGQYTVYHKGNAAYMLQLKDAAGADVPFKGVGMAKDENGKYFLNIVTADGVDTTGYSVSTWKGAASYLPKLGISGVKLNGTLMVDAEAIAAAEAAAAAATPAK